MKKKNKEQQRVIVLRKRGFSFREIKNQLTQEGMSAAKSSISCWVKDIELTQKQKKRLDQLRVDNGYNSANHNMTLHQKYKERRMKCRDIGKQRIVDNDRDFRDLCLLYWAEGSKTGRNSVSFINSDEYMMVLFVDLMNKCFDIEEVCVSTNTMSYAEYIECRGFVLISYLIGSDQTDIISRINEYLGISNFDFTFNLWKVIKNKSGNKIYNIWRRNLRFNIFRFFVCLRRLCG